MKKVYHLIWLCLALFAFSNAGAQTAFFQETFGLGSGYYLDAASNYSDYTGNETWSDDPLMIRNSNPSAGYADASGDAAMYLGPFYGGSDTVTMTVDTRGYSHIQLHFGFYNETGWSGIRNHTFNASYSTNGTDWTEISKTNVIQPDTFPANNVWAWVSLADELPAARNLSIMFWNPDANHGWQMDDITLTGTSSDATLSDLQVDGTTIDGFSANTTFYRYFVADGTTTVPQVSATPTNDAATAEVTQAAAIGDTAKIIVTAADGETQWEYDVLIMNEVHLGSDMILQETFGAGSIFATAANTYDSYSGTETWSDDPVTIRTPDTPSSGYAEASGDAALTIGPYAGGSDTVTMMGINTTGYKNIHLSFGIYNNTGWSGIKNQFFNATYSTDGGDTWTTLDKNFTIESTQWPANNVWAWISLGGDLPAADNLEFMFWNPSPDHGWIIDDIEITGTMLSSDATLANITINGAALDGFDAATTSYDVQIPGGALPTIEATANDAAATAVVSLPDQVPGTATITVTAEDGTVQEYTLNLAFVTSVGQYADFARIYPNPVADVMRISASKNIHSVEVLSVTGKVLMRSDLNGAREAQLNVSSLSKGLYIIRMTDADAGVHISRIVKR